MNRLRSLGRVVAAASIALLPVAASAGLYSGLYIFGDSLSDSGNNAVAFGTAPAQVVTGNSYIPSLPYASGQYSNGNVWARTFSGMLGLASYGQPSLAGGGDYAFGGARVATDGAGIPPSLLYQESTLFLAPRGGVAPSGALYVVAGGGNDARDVLSAAAAASTPSAAGAIIAAGASAFATGEAAIVHSLEAAGARHIVVWDVPNIGIAPAVTSLGASASFLGSQIAASMNSALAATLGGDADVSFFDIYGVVTSVVASPSSFGLANATDACGAIAGCDPQTYLYWDGLHPTSAGHAIIAADMFALAVPEPSEVALMLAGLAFVARAARATRRSGATARP